MSKIKRLVLIFSVFLLTLSTMFVFSSKSYAGNISTYFAKSFTNGKTYAQNTMAAIYYAMRTNPYKWVNSAVPAAEDSTDWRK
jgi:uncharacterized membrane protein